ncbi:transcriptional repressor [Pendulispora rubella]|uniref:Ferric uptake regulation protein n=1 Tax=Pendulispora rubella TaxID=2741070 RepID=A0ABZ2L0L8_9BACT
MAHVVTASCPEERIVRAVERFRAVLYGRDLRMTSVREAIVRAALEYDGHFHVQELARVLQERGLRDASVATVYRAMPLLVEAGIVQPALVSAGDEQRYEAAFERPHHDHLVCTQCGDVVEFHDEVLETLQRVIAERYGYELTGHVHELLGCCPKCRKKKR